jgi:8-oxo-dGTP pyrophosphatase MutT (NUDIX family)
MQKKNWQTLSEKEVYDNPWIRVTEAQVLNPNGGKGIYGVVDFKNLAIGVIPISESGETWIVGQSRYPFQGKFTWEIIEGGGPLKVDPILSAKRELQEEAGLTAARWALIQEMELSNSATTERALIYTAEVLEEVESSPDETELLTLKKIKLSTLLEMVLNGEIQDSLSVTGVLRLYYERPALFK